MCSLPSLNNYWSFSHEHLCGGFHFLSFFFLDGSFDGDNPTILVLSGFYVIIHRTGLNFLNLRSPMHGYQTSLNLLNLWSLVNGARKGRMFGLQFEIF